MLDQLSLSDAVASALARRLFPLFEREDLIQVAREALIRSAFSCRAGEPAAPYLRRCISGALQHHLLDRARLVRVPRPVHEAGDCPLGHSSLDASTNGEPCLLDQLASPEQEAASPAEDLALEQLVDQLPAAQTTALRLTILEGLSLRQAAEQLLLALLGGGALTRMSPVTPGSGRGACSGPHQSEALLGRASVGIGPVAAPQLAPIVMASLSAGSSAATSPFCRPEEDPFLLLESTLRSVEEILLRRRGLPLRPTWSEQPYGEEQLTLLEEEVIPAIQQCLARVDELDERLFAQQELMQRCEFELQRQLLSVQKMQMA